MDNTTSAYLPTHTASTHQQNPHHPPNRRANQHGSGSNRGSTRGVLVLLAVRGGSVRWTAASSCLLSHQVHAGCKQVPLVCRHCRRVLSGQNRLLRPAPHVPPALTTRACKWVLKKHLVDVRMALQARNQWLGRNGGDQHSEEPADTGVWGGEEGRGERKENPMVWPGASECGRWQAIREQ